MNLDIWFEGMFPNAIEATVEFILLLIRFIILIRLKFFAMQMFIVGGLQRRPPFKSRLKISTKHPTEEKKLPTAN